jgi:CBS domain-containing protein
MTANFNLVLPLMIGSGLAYIFSDRISSGSIYDRLLAFQGIHLSATPADANPWANLTAEDLMQRRVETLSATMTVSEALEAFSRSHHRGFPVLQQGKLVGIVTQTDLGDKTQSRASDLLLQDIMTPEPLTVTPESSLPHVLDLLNRLKVSRIPVTDGNKLVGIITRGDIIRAESERLSGTSTETGPARRPPVAFTARDRPLWAGVACSYPSAIRTRHRSCSIWRGDRPPTAVRTGMCACHIQTRILKAPHAAEAILQLSQRDHSDVILLGASREGLFSHVLHGNIPLAVAQGSDATVILVRRSGVGDPSGG